MVKEIKIPPLEPAKGIRASLETLFLWNPDATHKLIREINAAGGEVLGYAQRAEVAANAAKIISVGVDENAALVMSATSSTKEAKEAAQAAAEQAGASAAAAEAAEVAAAAASENAQNAAGAAQAASDSIEINKQFLQECVDKAAQAATDAQANAVSAKSSADAAAQNATTATGAESSAQSAAVQAQSSATAANESKTDALAAQTAASQFAASAATSAENAQNSKTIAEESATHAAASANAAQSHKSSAETAAHVAIEKAESAQTSAGNASASAETAASALEDILRTKEGMQADVLNALVEYIMKNGLYKAGFVGAFAGTTPPDGWLICDGSAISRVKYADLFAAIGTLYGAGDGNSTFNIPDAKNRFIANFNNFAIGAKYGGELPNIKGSFTGNKEATFNNATGAFRYGTEPAERGQGSVSGTGYRIINFNASYYNQIYKDSAIAPIPPFINMNVCIKY